MNPSKATRGWSCPLDDGLSAYLLTLTKCSLRRKERFSFFHLWREQIKQHHLCVKFTSFEFCKRPNKIFSFELCYYGKVLSPLQSTVPRNQGAVPIFFSFFPLAPCFAQMSLQFKQKRKGSPSPYRDLGELSVRTR